MQLPVRIYGPELRKTAVSIIKRKKKIKKKEEAKQKKG